ncbi:carboxyl transferase domain-containing protein [Nocardia sp. NPDC058176]|uniref:acetyl-CoA carboxylase family protein n=1 Tax=Nocardia sp. NPDC058176 TaxID=3346368 RepID=UPI0036DCB365
MKLVVANRGEIAVRILRTARERGYTTFALCTDEERGGLPARLADEVVVLPGTGAAAYLAVDAVVQAVRQAGDGALVHPGYGFLSENAEFAAACAAAGAVFVGPSPQTLRVLGDKLAARRAAQEAGLTVLPATTGGPTEIAALLAEHPAGVMIKAVHGGGGRGQRIVRDPASLVDAYDRCRSEALAGFGDDAVYAEVLAPEARHIEVQVIGDGARAVAVGDRDCSVQRRRQKLIEIAPAPELPDALRSRLHREAVRIAESVSCRGLATVEFLVAGADAWFLEVNPRLQVEHTVTEMTTGLDLVAVQIDLAHGRTLDDLDLPSGGPRGFAVQARINAELVTPGGEILPSSGVLAHFAGPTGVGVRVDTAARPGTRIGPHFDSLLAKVIAGGPSYPAALRRCADALAETVIGGVETNVALLGAVVEELVATGPVTTVWFENQVDKLSASIATEHATADDFTSATTIRDGEQLVRSPMGGTVVSIAAADTIVAPGGEVAVLEAMKMEHVIRAESALRVTGTFVERGTVVDPQAPLLTWTDTDHDETTGETTEIDLDAIRPDLADARERHRVGQDAARPEAVAKRHRLHRRTARENIADLVDEGSFREYGALAVAAQRRHRNDEDLIANTPADGLITGIATVDAVRTAVLSYDYTVLAGTQGFRNHTKTDRLLAIAHEQRLPVVFFTEGGGGRPGDTDYTGVSGLEVTTFRAMGALSGRVPLIGIVSGRCFAGNAALLGMCDVVIATPDANIGMGGPAMIEGGGLGVYAPEDIGPVEIQRRNGVVHLVADDEAHAVALARRCLSYFRGTVTDWTAPDPRLARHVVPENRLRAYDIRAAIAAVVDVDSMLELRADWGAGIVTALVRVEGRPLGLVANNGHHLGGAIDAPAADKYSAFLRLCDTHGLPVLALCDTPGFMVGPEVERDAVVTKFARLFIDAAALSVPFGTVVLRKGYGLGAQAMAAGSFRSPRFVVAWPTGEIGGMGLEGAVRLGFRKQLEAITDPAERQSTFDAMVQFAYANSKALNAAAVFELDDVIDPADTRHWITTLTT